MAIATLAIAVLPDALSLPKPHNVITLNRAIYQPGDGKSTDVSLPHASYPGIHGNPLTARYLLDFSLPTVPAGGLLLYIPTFNRPLGIALNGESLFNSTSTALWGGPLASTSTLVQLPQAMLTSGRNQLAITVKIGKFFVPTYLSQIYVGSEVSLAPRATVRSILLEQLKIVALAAHVLLGLGLICAYFFRPKDPLFSWLAVFLVANLIVAVGMFFGFQPAMENTLPYIVALVPLSGVLFIGTGLALIGRPPPRALAWVAVGVACVFLPLMYVDVHAARGVVVTAAAAIILVTFVAGTGVIAWGALRGGNAEARLMLAPSLLVTYFALRDAYVSATLPAHPYNLLISYARPLFLIGLTIVLMRRMGVSLDRVDRANEELAARLAEREAELASLHKQERVRTARLVREQERQRLTHDLHDGLSGHLVSIIALSERGGDKTTEQAAREALNDLRLVIYSLDLGDKELPLALANFRERLTPQMHRMGIELDWSMANLPEVSGVTPGNALAVLRIVQEAITNAIKHGPAGRIVIRGSAATDGMAMITVENDGRGFVESGGGRGLANMRRRAEQLHGRLAIGTAEKGVKLTLVLPLKLPDFEDETVA